MEDCAAFFTWLNLNGEAYKLSDHLLLGGSFAGAMTVLNLLFIGPYLDLNLPDIATGIALSGAFAYPSFYL